MFWSIYSPHKYKNVILIKRCTHDNSYLTQLTGTHISLGVSTIKLHSPHQRTRTRALKMNYIDPCLGKLWHKFHSNVIRGDY